METQAFGLSTKTQLVSTFNRCFYQPSKHGHWQKSRGLIVERNFFVFPLVLKYPENGKISLNLTELFYTLDNSIVNKCEVSFKKKFMAGIK